MSERQQDAALREELRLELEALLDDQPELLATLLEEEDDDRRIWWMPRDPSNRITDRIWCGGDDYLFDHRENRNLLENGITHVLDCRSEAREDYIWHRISASRIAAAKAPFNYLLNGTGDDGRKKSVAYFERSIRFGLEALSTPGAKIYVHCAAGINRGPSSCYAIMRAVGYNRTEAERLIRENRPGVGLAYLEDAEEAVRALGFK